MKRLLFASLLIIVGCSSTNTVNAQYVDSSKWYILDNWNNGWCAQLASTGATSNQLTLTATYSATAFSCDTGSHAGNVNYNVGVLMSSPFYFTFGKILVRGKLAPLGVHTTIWLWGGASGTSGYPPTCLAKMRAHSGFYMANCTADTNNAFEIDIGEFMPTQGSGFVGNNVHVWNNGSTILNSNHNYTSGVGLASTFNTYELDWTTSTLTFKFNGTVTQTIDLTSGTMVGQFQQPMFILLDQEIDQYGGYPGCTNSCGVTAANYPAHTYYQYVRVCSDVTAVCNPGDPTMIFDDEFAGVSTPQPPPTLTASTGVQGITLQGIQAQ